MKAKNSQAQVVRRSLLLVALSASALGLVGCATRVKPTAVTNPPPAQAFSAFSRIEILPIRVASASRVDASGVAKIQDNFQKDLAGSLAQWNRAKDNGRKLRIEPVVKELEFKHGAKRVFLGPMAGSSGVLIELNITDGQGRQIAKPEFFQRADAWAAGFVLGVHDNLMLTRVANLASGYVIDNYAEAKGGPTGADEKATPTVSQ